jgi:Peptidase family M28
MEIAMRLVWNIGKYCAALASLSLFPQFPVTASTDEATATAKNGTDQVSETALEAHMHFLASDLLEGREAGTRGYDIAAAYVAAQMRQMGLSPAGTDGYLQIVPLRKFQLAPEPVRLTIGQEDRTERYTDGDHIAAYPSESEPTQRVEASMVFAGHGIVAPEFKRDDYTGLDVRGKFVVVLGGPPKDLPADIAAHLGTPSSQVREAVAHGAVGIIFIYTDVLEQRFPFASLPQITRQPDLSWYDPAVPRSDQPEIRAAVFIDLKGAATLFEGAKLSLDQVLAKARNGAQPGFELKGRAVFERNSQIESINSANVAGLVRGTDPVLRHEVVVVTSHLDHVGIGEPVNGDAIYNGALDNASGIASMLEVARVLAADPPKRSVLFLAVTAEEKGLVGSDYFARKPTVPKDDIVGVVNIDGVMAFYDFTSVIGYGMQSSTMIEPLSRAAKSMSLSLMRDPKPELSIFTRSDHYPFVKQGIPAIFLLMGDGVSKDGKSGMQINDEWDDKHLHQPSDDLNQPLQYPEFARFTQLFRRFIVETANMAERPRWFEDDYFGNAFGKTLPKAKRELKGDQ